MRIAIALVTLLAACGWDQNPVLEKPTADYPCGPVGVVCAVQKTCCPPDNTCGGEPGSVGCPAGACCYIGGGDVGASKPTAQRPQR